MECLIGGNTSFLLEGSDLMKTFFWNGSTTIWYLGMSPKKKPNFWVFDFLTILSETFIERTIRMNSCVVANPYFGGYMAHLAGKYHKTWCFTSKAPLCIKEVCFQNFLSWNFVPKTSEIGSFAKQSSWRCYYWKDYWRDPFCTSIKKTPWNPCHLDARWSKHIIPDPKWISFCFFKLTFPTSIQAKHRLIQRDLQFLKKINSQMNHLYVNKKIVKQIQFRASKTLLPGLRFQFFWCPPGSRSRGLGAEQWTPLGMSKTHVNNGIKYQPQLVSWISAINIMQPSVWCMQPSVWLTICGWNIGLFSWQNPSGCFVMIQLDSSKSELPDATEVKTDVAS